MKRVLDPEAFVAFLGRVRATAILRTRDPEVTRGAMEAAIRGGFRSVEVTLTTPGALELIAELSERDDLVVGAGTVLDASAARDAVRAGASFLVSPVFDEGVIRAAEALGVASIPGVHTPTEMLAAHRAGATLLKLFPAPAGGPAFLRSVLGPLPFLRVVPTNGVDLENVGAWFDAGAFAAGFVAAVFAPADLETHAYGRIEERARELVARIDAIPRSETSGRS